MCVCVCVCVCVWGGGGTMEKIQNIILASNPIVLNMNLKKNNNSGDLQTDLSLVDICHCCYCLSCFLAWVRLISFYILNSTVGPLWIMLRKMLVEAVCFLSLLGVVTLAAGITLQVNIFAENTSRFAHHAKLLVVILRHIWFLVIIIGLIWFFWTLGSHTRILYNFLEIIPGS